MERKPFEIVAECEIAGFPTGADIERVTGQIEKARHSRPGVVQVTVSPPAIFRETRYVLQTRFTVWAEDGVSATQVVVGLLRDARVPCGTVIPSGRALTASSIPSPPKMVKPAPPAKGTKAPKAGVRRERPRTAKGAARRKGRATATR